MKKLVIVFASVLLLSGCSFEDIFNLVATPEERAQNEAFERSQIVAKKLETVNQKKNTYPEWVDLLKVNENDEIAATAFRDTTNEKATIEVEALLTNPNNQFYEAWLKDGSGTLESLGALEYRQLDDYGLKVEVEKEFKDLPTILITRESVADATPETVIMTGAFKAAAPTTSETPTSP